MLSSVVVERDCSERRKFIYKIAPHSQGLIDSRGQASSHVLGVSGGLYSKYPSFEVALEAYLNAERDSAVTVLV
jgi:hypothetical protein